MVQKKNHKNKAKTQRSNKIIDGTKLNAQLGAIGLKIIPVTADGNCLFRAVADQLEGNEEEHLKYREMVVDYIKAHREEYEPFIEDGIPFDEYCKSMRELGTWAGHMELQAISLVTHTNICIHRILSPRWHIHNFKSTEAHCIHLSYHNEEHYNSVRAKDDKGEGPAKTILLESPTEEQVERKINQGHSAKHTGVSSQRRQVYLDFENPCEKGASGDCIEDDDQGDIDERSTYEEGEDIGLQQNLQKCTSSNQAGSSSNGTRASNQDNTAQKKISRNKACPCGSKKKYKVCCGAVTRTSRVVTNHTEPLSNKARKEKLRNSKVVAKINLETTQVDVLDMGYLCI